MHARGLYSIGRCQATLMDLIAFEREQDARARKLLVFTRVQLRPTVDVILFVVQSQRAQPLQFVLAPIAKVELKIFVRDKRHYFVQCVIIYYRPPSFSQISPSFPIISDFLIESWYNLVVI